MTRNTPYALLGGDAGIRRLADAFYDVMNELPEAQGIRHMHDDNLDAIKQKLYEYLSGWLGGPPLYKERTGSVCLNSAHRPYAIGPAERDQWLRCMRDALERIGASAEVKAMLEQPLYNIADFLRTCDERGQPLQPV